MVQEKTSFKDISLELWRPHFSAKQNLFAILVEGILGTILLNFDFGPVVQEEMSFKDNLI